MIPSVDLASQTKEIFRLRKEGKRSEALSLANTLYRDYAADAWVIRAYAWCLYDEVKRLDKDGDAPALAAAIQKLAQLKIPAEDEILTQQVAFRLRFASPAGRAMNEAARLSKAGQHGEAVREARPFAGSPGASRETVLAYGWILYRKLKATDATEGIAQRIWCFGEFTRLWSSEWVADPMLTKCLLLEGMKNAESWEGFVAFVGSLGLEKLTAKDWVDERPGVDFTPFQHQLLKALYQALKHHPHIRQPTEALHRWTTTWDGSLSGGDWPDYHLGRILAWTYGDRAKARSLLIQTVQRNPNEFWRWRALVDAVEPEQIRAVLARAVACPCHDEQYKVGIYREFAEELAKAGLRREATGSFEEFLRLLRMAGKEFSGNLPVWYEASDPSEKFNLQAFAVEAGQEADNLLLEALPEHLGVPICKLPLKEEKKGDVFLYFFNGLGVRSVKFRGAPPPIATAAVLVKIRDNPDGLALAFHWTPTEIPANLGQHLEGVVNLPNQEKQLAPIVTLQIPFIPLKFDRWPGAGGLTRGDRVSLRILHNEGEKPVVLSWEKLPRGSGIPGLMMRVSGEYRSARDKAFGFIQSGAFSVFVSPADAQSFADGQLVSGMAIKSKDKHQRDSWAYLSAN
jgi:hypothetical protein